MVVYAITILKTSSTCGASVVVIRRVSLQLSNQFGMGGAMSSTGKIPDALGEKKYARPSSWQDRGWRFGIVLALGISGAIASSGNRTLAQITPDTSLGAESSVVTPNVINSIPSDQIDGGAVPG